MQTAPYLQLWQRELAKMRDQARVARLADEIRARHQYLSQIIPSPNGKILRQRRERLLLPGLALYQTLKTEYGQTDKALVETDRLFRVAFFRAERLGIPFLNLLPDPFPLIRPVLRSYAVSEYGPGELEVLTDTPNCFAMKVYRCYLFDQLSAQGAPELTRLFCATDDWLSALLPKVRWERSQTLGRGGAYCDFVWHRSKP